MLFKLVLFVSVCLVAAKRECKISDHVRKYSVWKVVPPRDIYGNKTEKSAVNVWTSSSPEEAINEQINKELFAQYTYMSMAAHFSRDDNFLPGFAKFFREAAEEEHKHAVMFMDYLNKRGGRVKLNPIRQPCRDQWGNGLMAMKDALELEKVIYESLLDVHKAAEDSKDPQMVDFIESNFLGEQVDSIKQLGNYIGTLGRIGDGLGEFQFDKVTLGGGK